MQSRAVSLYTVRILSQSRSATLREGARTGAPLRVLDVRQVIRVGQQPQGARGRSPERKALQLPGVHEALHTGPEPPGQGCTRCERGVATTFFRKRSPFLPLCYLQCYFS